MIVPLSDSVAVRVQFQLDVVGEAERLQQLDERVQRHAARPRFACACAGGWRRSPACRLGGEVAQHLDEPGKCAGESTFSSRWQLTR